MGGQEPAAKGASGPTMTSATWWSLQYWAKIEWLLTETSAPDKKKPDINILSVKAFMW